MNAASPAPIANPTYVIGHRNPDADAICSAIAYAAFKEARGQSGFVAARCGNSNARIDTILRQFNQPLPLYLSDVTPRVRDVMVSNVVTVKERATCAEALELIDRHDIRLLPVLSPDQRVIGTVSVFQLGGFFIPRVKEAREMRKVRTSLANLTRALGARVIHAERPEDTEEMFIRVGAMDVRSFWKISQDEGIPASQSIIIVGDRWDIQQRSLQIGVRALVVTGNLPVEEEVVAQAKARGVSVLVSPHDSANTAWIIRTASTIECMTDRKFASVSGDLRLSDLRRKFATANTGAFIVLNDEGKLQGILTRTDFLKPIKTRLVLVDHNELTQAVPGAGEVTITEIIDHHRLGALNTQQPILFLNEPVGSTCTIVADMFRREGLTPSASIAGVMMGGIISDTLHLNSPTSTEKDASILGWLSQIAGVNSSSLADSIFSSGSVILASAPDAVIRSDFKIYEEDSIRFSVSQVEELGFGNFWNHSKKILNALEKVQTDEKLTFAALLVTDINTQNSLLLVKGDADFISRINYPHVEKDEIFDLPGIVSRKKQLIPYLASLLKEMQGGNATPAAAPEALSA
ncbi:MAG TPA: putative manganese-dependent inorganic diphosphatase [Opitutaceae bacterium]|nr:putative manganese-dependent inorganic diphosphatase [Opitutaceae bacterium]